MPEMNGYEVCEHLKAIEDLRGIPVIFISALNENLDKVKAFAIGGVDYITKPFQMEELHARRDSPEAPPPANRAGGDQRATGEGQRPDVPRPEGGGEDPGDVPAPRGPPRPGRGLRLDLPALRRTGRRRPERHPARRRQGRALHPGRQRPWRRVGPAVGDAEPSPLAAVGAVLDPDPGRRRPGSVRHHAARRGRRPPEPALPLRPGDRAVRHAGLRDPGRRDRGVPLRLRRAPRPGASARRRRSGDPGEPGVPDRPGRRRLRGAVGPPGGGRPPVPLLRRRPRGDGPRRRAVRRRPAPGGDRPRAVRTAPGGCRDPPGGGRAVAWVRETLRRHLHPGGRGLGRIGPGEPGVDHFGGEAKSRHQ